MKNLIFAVLSFTLFLSSCTSTNNDEPTEPQKPSTETEEPVRYYVKYEITGKILNPNGTSEWSYSVTAENGVPLNFYIDRGNAMSWIATYGPVSKDFTANLVCYRYHGTYHARIYVCREKEPFVIKAEDSGETINLKYKIDF